MSDEKLHALFLITHHSSLITHHLLLCRADLCWSSMKQSENLIGAFPHGSSFEETMNEER